MIGDADRVPAGSVLRADLCIVGGGPAGIALALSLAGRGLQVLLLEAGRHSADPQAQALYAGELANGGHSPPDRYRLRGLGGSSAIWGGRCMPLDPIDLEARAWVPHSGWPLAWEELLPHYREANALCEAGEFAYSSREVFPGLAPLVAGVDPQALRTDSLERFSCPTDFGRRYRRRLELARDLRVLQGAVCTGVRLAPQGAAVERLDVATLSGHPLRVRARAYVLACGGLETPRLLLASDDVQPAGVGNRHGVVGRYYMCHIAGSVGELQVQAGAGEVRHGYEVSPDGVYCRRRLSLPAQRQRELGVLNAVARLHFPRISDPAHGSGVLSGLYLARRLVSYEYGRRLHDETPPTLALHLRHLANLARDAPAATAFLAHWLARRTLAARKFPSVILRPRGNRFSLEVQGEQEPRPDSRVMLADAVDPLGLRRVRVDWRHGEADIESAGRTLDAFAAEFARSGAGRFRYRRETLAEDLMRYGAYGGHHIGTTRMGRDPRTSVVDAQCRVHGVANLYVAGSAVFPTSGQANPTLTLVALSLRLGRHLAQALAPRRPPHLEVMT
ncbi:FAD-dependent oxidoreductase [Ramlibacter sp. MAHUQ-53]|uniref:FAD-dependent oxidoreductase n=1 Tax=unclassified Ramlibacter TaxID=2617605 RepID=UPI003637D2CE